MAKIKFGQGVADIRGHVGGSVFSRNSSGAYLREKVSPINPRTDKQLAVRAALSDLSKAWAALGESQREAWAALARAFPRTDVFGNPVPLTGLAQYQSSNLVLSQIEATLIDDAPSDLIVEEIGITSVDISAATRTLSIVVDAPSPPSGYAVYARCTREHSPGKSFVGNLLRFAGYVDPVVGSPDPNEIILDADFGAVLVGRTFTVHVMYVNKSNGALSTGVLRRVVVSA